MLQKMIAINPRAASITWDGLAACYPRLEAIQILSEQIAHPRRFVGKGKVLYLYGPRTRAEIRLGVALAFADAVKCRYPRPLVISYLHSSELRRRVKERTPFGEAWEALGNTFRSDIIVIGEIHNIVGYEDAQVALYAALRGLQRDHRAFVITGRKPLDIMSALWEPLREWLLENSGADYGINLDAVRMA